MQIVPARVEHAIALAPHMRLADVEEVQASGGYTPLEALTESLRLSQPAYTLFLNHEIAAMFGVVPVDALSGVGAVWLLTGTAVDRFPLAFLRRCRAELARLLAMYPVLLNAIDARYGAAVRWARWLGFAVGEAKPFGFEQRPFHPIRMEAGHV